jgi:hypothetical protein
VPRGAGWTAVVIARGIIFHAASRRAAPEPPPRVACEWSQPGAHVEAEAGAGRPRSVS